MKVGIANDHAATEMKFQLMDYLASKGYEVINYGFDTNESCDYPVAGERLAHAVLDKEVDLGIAICGTGVGISIACNKVNGIRAGVCSECDTARLIREHNNANILAFGARIVDLDKAKELVDTFLTTPFSNGERHNHRIALLADIEKRQK
ncbi:MAG: ribose 5-phosphate isomerase B [Erysipelotrichaceae bacterium]|nr:ribose 5-phosphate isomerase B [Erysipelotrichaceae bacterium]